jgi:hypothetical protein
VVNSIRKRVIATSLGVAFIATATAAAMFWGGAPADICLCPGRSAPQALAKASTQQAEALAGIPHTTAIPLAGAGKVSLSPLSTAASPSNAVGASSDTRSQAANAPRGWAWGNSSDHRTTSASYRSKGGASLGGLWRGMSPFGGHGSSSTGTQEHTTARTTHPAATRPPSSRPAPPSTPAPVPAPPATVPPADPGMPWPLPAPAPNASPVPLPLPGDPAVGGGGGGGAISASATPEPGSLALIATGVFGLFVARRRRNP